MKIEFLKNNKGYTIVELLAVVSILVILSGIITGILYSTLRGSSKTKITTEVVQNGDYALSLITSMIIDSENVTQIGGVDIADCTASPSGTSITFQRLDGSTTSLSCSGNSLSSGSATLINDQQVQVKSGSCAFYCDQKSDDPYAVPIVGVEFTLEDKSSGLFESKSQSSFKTAVSLRNYAP